MSDSTNQDLTTILEPAAERITLALVDQVKTIARLSGNWKNVVVFRPKPGGPPPLTDFSIEVELNTEAKEDAPVDVEQIRATHWLTCDVIISETSPESIETWLNRIKADVKKVIRQNPKLNGMALDTVMGDAVILSVDTQANTGRIVIVAETVYRTWEDDPYHLLCNPV